MSKALNDLSPIERARAVVRMGERLLESLKKCYPEGVAAAEQLLAEKRAILARVESEQAAS